MAEVLKEVIEELGGVNKVTTDTVEEAQPEYKFVFGDCIPESVKTVLVAQKIMPSMVKRAVEASLGLRFPAEVADFDALCQFVEEHTDEVVTKDAYNYVYRLKDTLDAEIADLSVKHSRVQNYFHSCIWCGFAFQPEPRVQDTPATGRRARARRMTVGARAPRDRTSLSIELHGSVRVHERYLHENVYAGWSNVEVEQDDILAHFGINSLEDVSDSDLEDYLRERLADELSNDGVTDVYEYDECYNSDYEELYDENLGSLEVSDDSLGCAVEYIRNYMQTERED